VVLQSCKQSAFLLGKVSPQAFVHHGLSDCFVKLTSVAVGGNVFKKLTLSPVATGGLWWA